MNRHPLPRLTSPARLLVLGDLMLDRTVHGDAVRVSPEAPALVLHATRHDCRLGGAAAVAMLAHALGADPTPAGITGADDDGQCLRALLHDLGCFCHAVFDDPTRPTTTKERLFGQTAGAAPVQLLRVDRESTAPLPSALAKRFGDCVLAAIDCHDAVLVSDYGKGVCSPALLAKVIERARACDVPVLVDPARGVDYLRYRGAALLTPNRLEAEAAIGTPIRSPDDALVAAGTLCERHGVGAVLVKLDRDGMVLAEHNGAATAFPTSPRHVRDVSGAGDTVLAALAVCRAAGFTWENAVPLANIAAGLQVERPGVAPVTWAEVHAELLDHAVDAAGKLVTLDQMTRLADAYRAAGRRVAVTNGCFDLLHPGHVACLDEAATLGDVLIVAVNSDASVRRLKGPGRPVMSATDRAALLAALTCVDHVLIFDDDTPHELLRRLRPDVLVKGGTYRADTVVGREIVTAYGGTVHVTAAIAGLSTTNLIAAARAAVP